MQSFSIIISNKSLTKDEKIIYDFIKDNGYAYTGGGDTKYGFTVFSKDGKLVGCFNMKLKKINCDEIPSKLDIDSTTLIDENKINKKLGH